MKLPSAFSSWSQGERSQILLTSCSSGETALDVGHQRHVFVPTIQQDVQGLFLGQGVELDLTWWTYLHMSFGVDEDGRYPMLGEGADHNQPQT